MPQTIRPQRWTVRLALAALLMLASLIDPRIPTARAAGITVTNNHDSVPADDGWCSLREAIINANNDNQSGSADCAAGSGADTITFAGDYTVSLVSALPPLTGTLTIDGSGHNVTVSGNNAVQVFSIQPGAVVTMSWLNIINGTTDYGGAILNYAGTLAISHSTFTGNHAASIGGGIFNFGGTLTVSDSSFIGNSAVTDGGGGIANSGGTLTVSNSSFSGNSATASGGGGISISSGSTVTVSTSTFSGNSANGGGGVSMGIDCTLMVSGSTFNNNSSATDGGGISNTGGTLTISNSTFNNNSATASGGGIAYAGTPFGDALTVNNSTFGGNHANLGGGILSLYGTLTISNSTFTGNSATTNGGGVYDALSTVIVTHSTFSANSAATDGGALTNNNGALTVSYSTFSGNSASNGGGIENLLGGTLTVYNSTFSGNSAATDGGGLRNYGGVAAINNSTLSGNQAGAGGGLRNHTGALYLRNNLIANSVTGGDCQNYNGGIAANTNNLIEDGSCSDGATGFVTGDPVLTPLGDYGGSILTLALLPGSPAIDAGDSATCADAATVNNLDQRGIARTFGASCDIGAFESRGFNLGSLTGTSQSAALYTAFATPLGLIVGSSYGEPVGPGGRVTLTAPGSGASVTFAPATIASTNAGGSISQPATANGVVGSYIVTATSRGAVSPASFNLTNLFASIVEVVSSPNPAVYGQSVTFTATVSGDGDPISGQVGFRFDGGAPISVTLVGGQASLTTSALTAGSHVVIAGYSGDGSHHPGSDVLDGGQTIQRANTTAALVTPDSPSPVGRRVTFTATVAAVAPGGGIPTGQVGFVIDGGAPISVTLVNGQASLSTTALTVGTHPITATYSGSANYNGSTSIQVTQVVTNTRVYLPFISHNFVAAPDLISQTLTAQRTTFRLSAEIRARRR